MWYSRDRIATSRDNGNFDSIRFDYFDATGMGLGAIKASYDTCWTRGIPSC